MSRSKGKKRIQRKLVLQEDEVNGIHVVAFAEETDSEGFEFIHTVKELAKHYSNKKDLSIVWIDPDDFALVR